MAGVQLKAVSKSFGNVNVIPNVDLDIYEGEFVVIVGPSGCGKSTTLRMIAGLEDATSGEIHIAGKNVTHLPPKQRDIAMVFQSYALYPHMDVAGNMSFSLRLANRPKEEINEKVERAADILGISELLKRKPKELSGGQRQRVAMGRAIVREAYCFLFDEPLSNLDAKLRSQMRTELAILHKRLNKTMVYVTHDQIEAMTMADRIVVMSNGHIQQVGTPREVYNRPDNLFVASFIGSPSMNLLPAHIKNEAGNLFVEGEGFKLPIPDHLSERVLASGITDTIAGLRPEHFSLSNDAQSGPAPNQAPIYLNIDVAEYIGSSQFLAAKIGATRVTAAIEVSADSADLGSGEYLFDSTRLYLFDPKNEKTI